MQSPIIKSKRHQEALDYALDVIRNSPLFPYVVAVYLFGSCARQAETENSDVDLLLELAPSPKLDKELRVPLRTLRSNASTNNIEDPAVDLKIVVGDEWRTSSMLFFENVRRDSILLRL